MFYRPTSHTATRAGGADVTDISGLSCRVGGAQDMVAAGIELGEIMQAGSWKTPAMVARYTEMQVAGRGAATKLAARRIRLPGGRLRVAGGADREQVERPLITEA